MLCNYDGNYRGKDGARDLRQSPSPSCLEIPETGEWRPPGPPSLSRSVIVWLYSGSQDFTALLPDIGVSSVCCPVEGLRGGQVCRGPARTEGHYQLCRSCWQCDTERRQYDESSGGFPGRDGPGQGSLLGSLLNCNAPQCIPLKVMWLTSSIMFTMEAVQATTGAQLG